MYIILKRVVFRLWTEKNMKRTVENWKREQAMTYKSKGKFGEIRTGRIIWQMEKWCIKTMSYKNRSHQYLHSAIELSISICDTVLYNISKTVCRFDTQSKIDILISLSLISVGTKICLFILILTSSEYMRCFIRLEFQMCY